ncbi:Fur family transcriptional regulator [Chloroflexota bacterium]
MNQPGDIISKLSEKGYRLTPQRLMILQAIENSVDHISAEEIYAQVVSKYPHINISTIYRTLELLKKLGLVTETDLGGGQGEVSPCGERAPSPPCLHRVRHHN